MSKIMLVEDDNSLREIYSIRLTAEGYVIVSAGDGEEGRRFRGLTCWIFCGRRQRQRISR